MAVAKSGRPAEGSSASLLDVHDYFDGIVAERYDDPVMVPEPVEGHLNPAKGP